MNKNEIIAFTDGSSRGNPGAGGYGAVALFPDSLVKEWGGYANNTTNNKMELMAVIALIEGLVGSKDVLVIYTDSQYVLNGITKWIHGWKKNNWITSTKTEVLNRDLWERLDTAVNEYKLTGKVKLVHVPGHSGLAGNEQADKIATEYADNKKYKLYEGSFSAYGLDIRNTVIDEEKMLKRSKQKKRSRGKAYSYVSCVSGEVFVDKEWKVCESRVKGKKGVKFKKALTKNEEFALIKEWKV